MNKKPTILVSAETGLIIRNILLGKFTEHLEDKVNLVFAVLNPEDSSFDSFKNKGIRFIPIFKFEKGSFKGGSDYIKSFQYWIYLFSIAWKSGKSIENYVKVYDFNASKLFGATRKIIVNLGKLIKVFNCRQYVINRYLEHYEKNALTYKWEKLLKEIGPDFVLSTILSLSHKSVPSTDLPLVLACRKLHIKTGTLIQSWDNLSTKPCIIPKFLNVYFTWSKMQSDELIGFFPEIDIDRIKCVGGPQFDFHVHQDILVKRHDHLEKIGFSEHDKYILICTGMEKSLPREIDETMLMIDRINFEFPNLKILLRIHPKDHTGRIDKYIKNLKNTSVQFSSPKIAMDAGGFVPPLDFYKDQVNAIYHSDLIINSSSTVTVDAAIIDKPIICIGYNYFEDPAFGLARSYSLSQSLHYARLANSGGVWLVQSENELVNAIKTYMEKPIHAEGRIKIVKAVTEVSDGKAGIRMAEEVVKQIGFNL